MRDKDLPPDNLRCKRTDGRQWRCKRPAKQGLTLCEIHHLQGKHRQNKQKVPDSLKLERKVTKKKRVKREGGESSRVLASENRRRCLSEALDDVLKKMELKRGDLHLDLIRMFLKRQVEKKKEKELKETSSSRIGGGDDETMKFHLPYGVMAISQLPPETSETSDVKLGFESNGVSTLQRQFRSKNLEPLPIDTMQVVPFAEIAKKRMIKKCHWCRESKDQCLINCLTCKKRSFCVECINERYLEKKEVKVKCPACRGTCDCKICKKKPQNANKDKGHTKDERKNGRIEMFQYLIYMLLPVLKQINSDQSIELEREAKITGNKESEIQILQTKFGCQSLICCRCKTPVVDYHRTCTNCSYNLCLSCCRELSQHVPHESFKLKRCRKRKTYSYDGDQHFKQNISRQDSGGVICSLQRWEANADGSIPCPSKDIGGCGESILDLRCIFPFTLPADLEVRAEENLCNYQIPETSDVSSSCSVCNSIDSKDGVKPSRELSRRLGFCDNYIYCPTVKDLHQKNLAHFQNHWGKGHPVIVRNMLPSISGLSWDPISMLCSYMESKSSEPCTENGIKENTSRDWCDVEISRKRILMGSLERGTHVIMKQKALRFKAWLSSGLFQKQFPVHYEEMIKSLPLLEYTNPVSGLLNLGVKLPKEFPKPDLGPSIHFSYGSPEELMQPEYLSKLCYGAHDTVNILAYAMDVENPPEQILKIENLMKKCKGRENHGQSFSNSSDQKGKSPLKSEETGESGLQDVGEKTNIPNGIKNVPFHLGNQQLKGQTITNGNGKLNEDSDDSDDEASMLCYGSVEDSEDSDYYLRENKESSCTSEDKRGSDSCGAQFDIFRRQDAPKLVEYLKRHSNELSSKSSHSKLVHPLLDDNYFLDAYHKLKLKEEFDIQPWTFEQYPGEAVLIPAGCPYQVRKLRACVNINLDFISPENATQCIQLREEIRNLPLRHNAKTKLLEVEKMSLHGISAAIEEICHLTRVDMEQVFL